MAAMQCLAAVASAGISTRGVNFVDFTVNYVYSDRVSRNTAGQVTVSCSFDATGDQMNLAFLTSIQAVLGLPDLKTIRLVNPLPK